MKIPSRFRYPALLAVVLFVVYTPALNGSFHYDDGHSIRRNPAIDSLAHIPSFFIDPRLFSANPAYAMYRPMVLTSYALNNAVAGRNPALFLLGNLLIHIVVTVLFYWVLRQLGLAAERAFFAALLFGVHPLQTEPVNYISARSESLAALGVLGGLGAYLRHGRSSGSAWLVLALILWSIGLFAKATAVVLPALLLVYLLINGGAQRNIKSLIPFILVGAAYILTYALLTPQALSQAGQVRPFTVQIATQAKALVYYIDLLLFPTGLNVLPQFFAEWSLWAPLPWLGLLLAASLLLCAVGLSHRYRLASFGLAWFFICLGPTLVIPLNILVNNHRLYLPLAGFIMLLCSLLPYLPRRWPGYLMALVWTVLAWQHSAVWKDELTLWSHAAARAPLMPEARYNLGFALHQSGQLTRAREEYEQAVALNPQYSRALSNLGAIYRQEGRFATAETTLTAALKYAPEQVETLNNLGLTYTSLQDFQAAVATFKKALALAPAQAELWFNLGLAYRNSNQPEAAFQALSRAVELDPALKQRFPAARPSQ